jgi:hypothetical protein
MGIASQGHEKDQGIRESCHCYAHKVSHKLLFYCLQDTTIIASTVATSGHYLYQVEFLRCLGNEFYSIQLLHSSGSSIPANLQRLLWHTLWVLRLYEPANQYLFYHYQVSLWRMRAWIFTSYPCQSISGSELCSLRNLRWGQALNTLSPYRLYYSIIQRSTERYLPVTPPYWTLSSLEFNR